MLLALLAATTQHNYQTLSVFAEIDPVSRPEVDSVLEHTGTNTLNVREISGGKPGQSCCHFGRSLRVQISEPIRKRATTFGIEVFSNFDHSLRSPNMVTHTIPYSGPAASMCRHPALAPVSHPLNTPNLRFPLNNLPNPPHHPSHRRAIPMPGDISMTPTASTQPQCVSIRNRANAQHSTGPRSEAGKQRSALNALTHGLTARTAVLPSEDPAAYEQHHHQFLEEYRPATPTETQLVHELADTSWRLNRIPLLEADVLSRAQSPAPSPQPPIPSPGRRGACDARPPRPTARPSRRRLRPRIP